MASILSNPVLLLDAGRTSLTVSLRLTPSHLRILDEHANDELTTIPLVFVLAATQSPATGPSMLGKSIGRVAQQVQEVREQAVDADPSCRFAVHYFAYTARTGTSPRSQYAAAAPSRGSCGGCCVGSSQFAFAKPQHAGAKPRFVTLTFETDTAEAASEWLEHLSVRISDSCGTTDFAGKRALVIVNPVSGRRAAPHIYRQVVKPMLSIAGIDVSMIETTGSKSATKTAQSLNIKDYSVVMLIGGDGLIHEFVNGLLTRPDWEEARLLPMAPICGGSGNGMARSLDVYQPELGVLSAIKGHVRPLDIMSYAQEVPADEYGHTVLKVLGYSHLSLSWAFLADVDIGSEVMRWAGPTRFDVYSALRFLSKHFYAGRLSLLPADVPSQLGSLDYIPGSRPTTHATHVGPQPIHIMEPMSAILAPSSPWVTLPPQPFYFFHASNIPFLSSDFNAAPHAHFGDGAVDLIFDSNPSWKTLMTLGMRIEEGVYVDDPEMTYVQVKALILEPLDPTSADFGSFFPSSGNHFEAPGDTIDMVTVVDSTQNLAPPAPLPQPPPVQASRDSLRASLRSPAEPMSPADKRWKRCRTKGFLAVDGEEIEYRAVRIEVHAALMRLMVPPWVDMSAAASACAPGTSPKQHVR
ncbi:hypothetical protein RI367_006781 [Sorochytrium milnesiophthora]